MSAIAFIANGFTHRLPNFFSGQIDKDHPVYPDDQLEEVLELALNHTDLNDDGYIDYTEYRLQDFKAKKARQEKEMQGNK